MARFQLQLPWRRVPPPVSSAPPQIAVGARNEEYQDKLTFDNRNITSQANLKTYDFDRILRDKQNNIYELFKLANYFVDKDPIFHGIIKNVYTPFACGDWVLVGVNDQVREKYEKYYDRIHLRDRMDSIFYQNFLYANVYVYLMEDGNIMTLPVHKCRIGNMMVNGEPVVEFDTQSLFTDPPPMVGAVDRKYLSDNEIEERLKGYPIEIREGAKRGDQWTQLNPKNTYVLQETKEDWLRYAIPMIANCLTGLAKKEKIQDYEGSILDLGIRAFLHVKYGNKSTSIDKMYEPNEAELGAVNSIFSRAMSGTALATTNDLATAEFVQPDMNDLFQFDKYSEVNSEILAGGGISGIIVSGQANDGSTFATAQVSMQTAALRIKRARDNFCELMNRINQRINGSSFMPHSSPGNVPKFTMPPVDLTGDKKLQEVGLNLWKLGTISRQSMLSVHGYDLAQEEGRRAKEAAEGIINPQVEPTEQNANTNSGGGSSGAPADTSIDVKIGRPVLEDDERTSDPANALRGKQPKPSNEDGSL